MPTLSRAGLQQAGVGLPQLLVVTLILAILAALALPAFRETLARMRAETLRAQLVSVLSTARSSAITRQHAVEACASSDGRTCGSDWSHGWLLYVAPPPSAPEPTAIIPLLVEQRTPGELKATGNRGRVRFRADGRNGGRNLTIRICIGQALHSKVVVSVPGRVRSQRARTPTPTECNAP